MKKFLILFSVVSILISCGSKEAKKEVVVPVKKEGNVEKKEVVKEAPKLTLVFTVQIGANKIESKIFSAVKGVSVCKEEGLYKYRLGAFKTYKEAKTYRMKILHKFPGAFVQALKGTESITIQAAIK